MVNKLEDLEEAPAGSSLSGTHRKGSPKLLASQAGLGSVSNLNVFS